MRISKTQTELERLAYGVLFPVMVDLRPSKEILSFLDKGGKSILFGEHSDEYLSGKMRQEKLKFETSEIWTTVIEDLRQRSDDLLVALDADISAVNRLQGPLGPLPELASAQEMAISELENVISVFGQSARSLGVNMFLSPTADVIAERNDWLDGRTLGKDIATVSRLVEAFVKGANQSGVQATLKHFPGHPSLSQPLSSPDATVSEDLSRLRPYFAPFDVGIRAGAQGVMMGPALFLADNPPVSASISPTLISCLRKDLGFKGLIITCDLDHRPTQQDRTIEATSVQALNAGADLLLLSPNSVGNIPSIVSAIVQAVESEILPEVRLRDAATSVLRRAAFTG